MPQRLWVALQLQALGVMTKLVKKTLPDGPLSKAELKVVVDDFFASLEIEMEEEAKAAQVGPAAVSFPGTARNHAET